MIDLLKIRTRNQEIVWKVYNHLLACNCKKKKDLPYLKTFNLYGIEIGFNKTIEGDMMYMIFSPHKQSNGNLHNANSFPVHLAQKQIINTLYAFGIPFQDFAQFDICRIEIGVNYTCEIDSDTVLNSFLLFGTALFKKDKFAHYRYADYGYRKDSYTKKRTPYQTFKHYLKDRQEYKGITNAENGYCDEGTIRTEIKVERSSKVKELGLQYLNDLYADNVLERFNSFLQAKFERVFIHNAKEIDRSKLTTVTQQRHYYQLEKQSSWHHLEGRKLTESKKRWLNLPRLYNTKKIILNAIITAITEQNSEGQPEKNTLKLHQGDYNSQMTQNINVNKGLQRKTNGILTIDVENTTRSFCSVTGEEITMQRNGEPYLKRDGLRYLYQTNRTRFFNLLAAHKDTKGKRRAQTVDEQIVLLETAIRKKYYNPRYNTEAYIRRNYSEYQLQFFS